MQAQFFSDFARGILFHLFMTYSPMLERKTRGLYSFFEAPFGANDLRKLSGVSYGIIVEHLRGAPAPRKTR
jgi:hypothetical protein